ncbi:MAG: preprotein translocase subunit YajC [Verrucomicrobia bacterium]|nr:preprotein translocase subunit YajC [Verrucomicrobiota bacterium]
MIFSAFSLLALAPPPQPGQPAPPWWVNMVPMVIMIVVFYLILIRPQQKKAREHSEMLKNLKPGDKVTTSGGLVGVVVSVKDRTVSLRSADTKIEVLKSAVNEITERASSEA